MDIKYFQNRATIRNYTEQNISQDLLEEIIKEASHAPTCGCMQLYSIIVTRDKQELEKLVPLHYSQPAAATANMILTICADFNRFTKWCYINNANPGFDNFHSFLNAFTDAVILAQQIVTIAEMKGLGSCYLGTVTYNADKISDLLQLPTLVVPVVSVSLGYPEGDAKPTPRLPLNAVIHAEKYREDSDCDIKEFFKVRENDPDNKTYIKENGKENIAQVFTDVRYPGDTNEKLSEMYLTLLKTKGFLH